MKFASFTVPVVLGLAFMSAAQRTWACFPVGVYLGSGNALYHARRACSGYDGKTGAFQGQYSRGEEKAACIAGSPGFKTNLAVRRLESSGGNARVDLSDSDCEKEFEILIEQCNSRGGRSYNGGWTF